jgi:hypothetical protein
MAHLPSKTSNKRSKASMVDDDPLVRHRHHHTPAIESLLHVGNHSNPGIGKTTPLNHRSKHINGIPYAYTDHEMYSAAPTGA